MLVNYTPDLFMPTYLSEEDRLDAVMRLVYGGKCPLCGVAKLYKTRVPHHGGSGLFIRKEYTCKNKHTLRPMARTFMVHSSTRLEVWFLAMRIWYETGELTPVQLSRMTGIKYSTCWRVVTLVKRHVARAT